MAVLTWRNVNAPSSAGLSELQAANALTSQGIQTLNAGIDRFREDRSDLAEAEVAQRVQRLGGYDQLQQAQQSGSLFEGINSSHLTPDALGRINDQSDALLRRSVQEEGLNQSRTIFGNQQDDRANEQAATPVVAQLLQAASSGDRNAVQRIYAEHGDTLSSLPLDQLQSVSTGAMSLEQGRSGINNQLASQRIAQSRLGLEARRLANQESQTAYNRQQASLQNQQSEILAQGINALLLGSNTGDDAVANYNTLVNSEVGEQFTPAMRNQLIGVINQNFPGALGAREVNEAMAANVTHPALSLINNSVNENINAIAQSGAPTYVDDLREARQASRASPIEVSQGLAELTGMKVTDVQNELNRILRQPGVDGNANVAGVILQHSLDTTGPTAMDLTLRGPFAENRISFNRNAINSGIDYLSNQGPNSNFAVNEHVSGNTQNLRGLEQELREEVVKLQEAQRRADANPGLANSVARQESRVERISERIQEAVARADAERNRLRETRNR